MRRGCRSSRGRVGALWGSERARRVGAAARRPPPAPRAPRGPARPPVSAPASPLACAPAGPPPRAPAQLGAPSRPRSPSVLGPRPSPSLLRPRAPSLLWAARSPASVGPARAPILAPGRIEGAGLAARECRPTRREPRFVCGKPPGEGWLGLDRLCPRPVGVLTASRGRHGPGMGWAQGMEGGGLGEPRGAPRGDAEGPGCCGGGQSSLPVKGAPLPTGPVAATGNPGGPGAGPRPRAPSLPAQLPRSPLVAGHGAGEPRTAWTVTQAHP